jgi:hypothetical protein
LRDFVPTFSRDLNPIGQAFSKAAGGCLRKGAAGRFNAISATCRQAREVVCSGGCADFFPHAGYAIKPICSLNGLAWFYLGVGQWKELCDGMLTCSAALPSVALAYPLSPVGDDTDGVGIAAKGRWDAAD